MAVRMHSGSDARRFRCAGLRATADWPHIAMDGSGMKFAGTRSWRMSEDASWHLAVALYIRDALKLPATQPFFVPPLVPSVPEHIPVTGPDTDLVLADEWAHWFTDLLADHMDMGTGQPLNAAVLERRSPAFQAAVLELADAGRAAATAFRDTYFQRFHANSMVEGMAMTKLVAAVAKELGHKAAPFSLDARILPVEGHWLHRAGPSLVLLSEETRRDHVQLGHLLGPIVRELAD